MRLAAYALHSIFLARFYDELIPKADASFDADLADSIAKRQMMARTLEETTAALPARRRAKVEARTAELIAEERTLQDLRRAMKKTQAAVAKKLKIKQENVSRLEGRADLLISTLEQYVSALGGKLHFVAEFPNRPPVRIRHISSLLDKKLPKRTSSARRTA
jgi:hypothetical protein